MYLRLGLILTLLFSCSLTMAAEINSGLMPQEKDRTSMWWRDGFPSIVENAAWRRVVKTGYYWFMLDTDTLKIPRLGSTASPVGELPGAELELSMTVDGKTYHCTKSAGWSRFAGPRLIESGRFLQRADVTDLIFTADDGSTLNTEARFETVAWADQLGLILSARPGNQPISAGDSSFGRVNGGFGLDGTNQFEIAAQDCLTPEVFTLEFWTFVPNNYKAGKHSPWLVCKNNNELGKGNYGIMIHPEGIPEAVLNVEGGRESSFRIRGERQQALKVEQWNHLALTYDGELLKLYVNGRSAGEVKIGKKRIPTPGGLTFGARQDKHGDGYRYRGVVDEIRIYDRALELNQIRSIQHHPETGLPHLKPISDWAFRDDIPVSMTMPRETWDSAAIEIRLANEQGEQSARWDLPNGESWNKPEWQEAALMINPITWKAAPETNAVSVVANEKTNGKERPVVFEPSIGWHRVNLDGITPTPPPGGKNPSNDAIERVRLTLSNPTDEEQIARLMFEKTPRGIHQRIGTPITGISAILRDREGNPTGIPVQLSKNWHNDPLAGEVHSRQWFHGISQVRLQAGTTIELELTLAYGHWGGVAAASHAQLSLIGWGGNQRWDQSALGSWGESICYDPEQSQANCSITDVRPLMVNSTNANKPQWGWTTNVGGGDFFRFFDKVGKRSPHVGMRAKYHRQGPCLTESTYTGSIGKTGIHHRETVSLGRSDDVVCGTYQINMTVTKPIDSSRFVIFQIGADTYINGTEKLIAHGNETGLKNEWEAQSGGNIYRREPTECDGNVPWVSMHGAVAPENETGAWANRGIVIRKWKAKLGGKEAKPWIAERGIERGSKQSSSIDLVPPPGITRLEPGDFVSATIEHIVLPQFAKDYYGPNEDLHKSLAKSENTWKMIHRQATRDDRQVNITKGKVIRVFPDIQVSTVGNEAEFTLQGGLGYVPLTFTGLTSFKGYVLTIDGSPLDQNVHGNDFWQTDFDSETGLWNQTYNIPVNDNKARVIRFEPVN